MTSASEALERAAKAAESADALASATSAPPAATPDDWDEDTARIDVSGPAGVRVRVAGVSGRELLAIVVVLAAVAALWLALR